MNISIDILTYEDLENMKGKEGGSSSSNLNLARLNKRYIILTVLTETDKVHYPLSLNLEENHDIEKLKDTFTKLKF